MRSLALTVLVLAAAVWAAAAIASSPLTRPPRAPAPSVGSNGPPPAWIETARGSFWLAYSTFCWGGRCADYALPSCGVGRIPKIRVRRGELVRFHLGFEPRDVTITTFAGKSTSRRLAPVRNPAWRVRAGAFALFALPKKGAGDASYVGCVVLR